jgi:hypothetical protein
MNEIVPIGSVVNTEHFSRIAMRRIQRNILRLGGVSRPAATLRNPEQTSS